jgi:16S rRNA G966 N2-methylase RsmD
VSIESLPDTLTVPRTDAVYNCHAYLTKVPIGAILPFINEFTGPGDTVLDPFAGSGMTGLAAGMVGRKAELSDISKLGQHIATGYLTRIDPSEFREGAESVKAIARAALGDRYTTNRAADGASGEMVRTVWSFVYVCPVCKDKLNYFEQLSPDDGAAAMCQQCGCRFEKRKWIRSADVPVEVVVRGTNGRLAIQQVSALDHAKIEEATQHLKSLSVPSCAIAEHREMFSRSGLRKAGLSETSQFFSPRNAIALTELWSAINAVSDESLCQKLKFCFTAILTRASRRYQWSRKTPLNAQNQTYYISAVYYEWNIFELFDRKIEAAIRADNVLYSLGDLCNEQTRPRFDVRYVTASASNLGHLRDKSIDYIFTDPPFGSNIFYSDMNLFHEAWLGMVTDPTEEAVVRTSGKMKNASAVRYEQLLKAAFSEGHRVLKAGCYMSIVFGNSDGRIWGLVQRSLRDCGFDPAPVHVAILDKGQRSVKGLASGSEGVVTVDLIMTIRKPTRGEKIRAVKPSSNDQTALVTKVIASLPANTAKNPSHVYARVLSQAIKNYIPLDDLHLADVLSALKSAGYVVDGRTGLMNREPQTA